MHVMHVCVCVCACVCDGVCSVFMRVWVCVCVFQFVTLKHIIDLTIRDNMLYNCKQRYWIGIQTNKIQ